MAKRQEIRNIMEELFSDGVVHTKKEIALIAINKGIIDDENDSSIRNAILQMKKEDESFVNVGRGKYKKSAEGNSMEEKKEGRFELALECILQEVSDLKRFDWVNCTDEELLSARDKIFKLKKVFGEVQKLLK